MLIIFLYILCSIFSQSDKCSAGDEFSYAHGPTYGQTGKQTDMWKLVNILMRFLHCKVQKIFAILKTEKYPDLSHWLSNAIKSSENYTL
jgi:hypothetical protein